MGLISFGASLPGPIERATELPNLVAILAGGKKAYSLDAPGINRLQVDDYVKQNAKVLWYAGNFTSSLQQGNMVVERQWSVTVKVNLIKGTISGQFRRSHIRLN